VRSIAVQIQIVILSMHCEWNFEWYIGSVFKKCVVTLVSDIYM